MRQRRIKIPAQEGPSVYHCVTRTVNGEWLFDDRAKEVLRKQIWDVADFCGVQMITYTILSNHFHVLVRIPQEEEVSDAELFRRYAVLHPRPALYEPAGLQIIRSQLRNGGPAADAWRKRQLALMGDVSQFMKLLKQRYSIWFNKTHERFGTLWAERYKSVLVEEHDVALQTMAAYIDLNSVRAGLVSDPKDYRFCGYAEAVAGYRRAQNGIAKILGENNWDDVQSQYREMLFGTGAAPREGAASISPDALQRVLQERGNLSRPTVLRCRLRFLTDGAIFGSRNFVALQLATFREKLIGGHPVAPKVLPPYTNWGDLATLRGFKSPSATS